MNKNKKNNKAQNKSKSKQHETKRLQSSTPNDKHKTSKRKQQASLASRSANVRTKYVLDAEVKKALVIVIAVIILIIAAISTITLASKQNSYDDGDNTKTEQAISLIGLTTASKSVIDSTAKFDDFNTVNGHSLSEIYDTRITLEDAQILEQRGQYPTSGIFAYNADISSNR